MFHFCILIHLISYSAAGTHDGIVRLDCTDNIQCFGVALNWNLILTTSSCAQSCSLIIHNREKFHIERTLYHPQGRHARHVKSPRKLAIIQVEEGILSEFVRLLSIDIELIVGTPVIFSIAAKSVTFKEEIVKYCMFELKRSGRTYICTRGYRKYNCSLEGLPLFKDKRVIALTEKQKVCNIQRAFISVGTYIPWVNSVLKYKKNQVIRNGTGDHLTTKSLSQTSKGYRKKTIRHVTNPKVLISKSISKNRAAKETSLLLSTFRMNTRNFKSCSRNTNTMLKSLNNKGTVRKTTLTFPKTPTKSIVLPVKLSSASKRGYLSKSVTPKGRTVSKQALNTGRTTRTTDNKFPIINNVSQSFAPNPMSPPSATSKLQSHLRYPISRESSTRNKTSDLIKLNESKDSLERNVSRINDLSTNALDWFKKRLDDRLKEGPPPVLVLTTGEVTKEFVDLT